MSDPRQWYPMKELPAFWLLRAFGFSVSSSDRLRDDLCTDFRRKGSLSRILRLIRIIFLIFFVAALIIWFIIYTLSVLNFQIDEFQKALSKGTEKASSMIVRILDEVPWVLINLRSFVVLSLFFFHHRRILRITEHLRRLLVVARRSSWETSPLASTIRSSFIIFGLSVALILLCFIMVLLYWNKIDFSENYETWDFYQLNFVLLNWHVTILLTFLTMVPFVMTQMIVASLIGLGEGGRQLLYLINRKLKKLAHDAGNTREVKETVWTLPDKEGSVEEMSSHDDTITSIRAMHFKATQYVEELSEAFSKIFLVVVAADFATSIGFVGLLIGYENKPGVNYYFDRVYHATATLVWMGFFLCTQYWPLVQLHEEAEETYHHVQALTFIPEATQDDMITLLCSYGILVYELLHREAGAGKHGEKTTNTSGTGMAEVIEKLDELVAGNTSYELRAH
ncbi:hypothetical protein RvY_19051 [Ramazzottius varieornatus]|uniref:Gustatory receptor n=1 Tax=Ramazzottius varieornatus TaxID=947166 RepID=A0A1D1WC07_RAMVA|nr:hypothetical protein RvY_19051 [Ramazzottius varieornatus]